MTNLQIYVLLLALRKSNSVPVQNAVSVTPEEYSALEEYDGNTLYIVEGTPPELFIGRNSAALFGSAVYNRAELTGWSDVWELDGSESEEILDSYNHTRVTGKHGHLFHPLSSDGSAFLKITNSTSDHFVIVFEPVEKRFDPTAHKVEFTLETPLTETDTLTIDGQTRHASVIGEDGSETDISGLIDWQNWLTFRNNTFLVCDEGDGDMVAFVKCRNLTEEERQIERIAWTFVYLE